MDEKYMKRAFELAEKGAGYTSPNPLVGAVIVKDGKIIGEGFHEAYGGNHAEANALLFATEDVSGADMYVTLEPCSHYGKTPPCAKAVLESGIKRVFISVKDPNPLVSGNGIRLLEDSGVTVVTGVLEQQGRKLNEIFLKYITTKLPFCIMKTAMTLDGKIASRTGDSKWVTGECSRKYVHMLRHRVSGIMVGVGTVVSDDPQLSARADGRTLKDPARIIVDTSAHIPLSAKVLNLPSKAPTIVAVTEKALKEKLDAIEQKGAEVITTPLKDGGVDLTYLMKSLGEKKIDSVLLEGGSRLNYSALQEGIVDKLNIFIAPKIIGGDTAKTLVGGYGRELMADALPLWNMRMHQFDEDIMIEAYTHM